MIQRFAVVVGLVALALSASAAEVAYPDGFRNDRHVKSMVINKGHPLYDAVGGIHHVYANTKALAGYKAGRFADGAILTFDLFEAVDNDNAVTEGAHKAVLAMVKDSRKYKATDGWGYQVFDPKTKKGALDAKAQAECHACHQAQKAHDYVFSSPRN
jgi:hypothetical protein